MQPKQHLEPNCAPAQARQSKSTVRQIYEDRAKYWTLYEPFKHPSRNCGRAQKANKKRKANKNGHGVSQKTRHEVPRKRSAETHLGDEVTRAGHLPQLPLRLLSGCRLLLIITGETKHREAKNQKGWRIAKKQTHVGEEKVQDKKTEQRKNTFKKRWRVPKKGLTCQKAQKGKSPWRRKKPS